MSTGRARSRLGLGSGSPRWGGQREKTAHTKTHTSPQEQAAVGLNLGRDGLLRVLPGWLPKLEGFRAGVGLGSC